MATPSWPRPLRGRLFRWLGNYLTVVVLIGALFLLQVAPDYLGAREEAARMVFFPVQLVVAVAITFGVYNAVSVEILVRRATALLAPGDTAAAEQLLGRALAGTSGSTAAVVQIHLAAVYLLSNRVPECVELLEKATPSVRGAVRASALANLGLAKYRLGDLAARHVLWDEVLAGSDPVARAFVGCWLGEELLRAGDTEGAEPHLERALSSPQPEIVACSQANLGQIRFLTGQIDSAEQLWNAALTSGFVSASTQAQVYLAGKLIKDGDRPGARKLLTAVIAADYPDSAADAQKLLEAL